MDDRENYHGLSVDIWSSGIVLYAMILGFLPCFEGDEEENVHNIINGNILYN